MRDAVLGPFYLSPYMRDAVVVSFCCLASYFGVLI